MLWDKKKKSYFIHGSKACQKEQQHQNRTKPFLMQKGVKNILKLPLIGEWLDFVLECFELVLLLDN